MPVIMDVKVCFYPGTETWVSSTSQSNDNYSVVFEDDEETAYFYACCLKEENSIYDAVHIYNVDDVKDKNIESELKVGWSPTGEQAILMINDYPHAIFDFKMKKGSCRNNFPPSNENWSLEGHAWDEELVRHFK